jgi:Gamma tubulin complex component C-terminal/Gamma tubulin complex component N-terminal
MSPSPSYAAVSQFHAFAVPDLWRVSTFAATDDDASVLFPDLHPDGSLPASVYNSCLLILPTVLTVVLNNPYAPKINLVDDLKLPDVESFHYGPLLAHELSEPSVISTDPEHNEEAEEDEDIWALVADPLPEIRRPQYLLWRARSFAVESDNRSPYLSEWGTSAFDAALRKSRIESRSGQTYSIVEPGVVLRSLYDLGLGRSSLLYNFIEDGRNVNLNLDHFIANGLSSTTLRSLEKRVKGCGMAIKYLREFSDRTYISPTFPAKVAFAHAVSTIIATIEAHFSHERAKTRSWIQLQYVFAKAEQLLDHLVNMVQTVKSTRCDEDLVSIIFGKCQNIEHDASWLWFIMLEMLSRVSHPLLSRLNMWTGQYFDQSTQLNFDNPGLSFIQVESEQTQSTFQAPTYTFNPDRLPIFISREQGHKIFETGQCLRLLHRHKQDNANILCSTSADHALKWSFQWADVDSVVNKAREYEKNLANAVRQCLARRGLSSCSTSIDQPLQTGWLNNMDDSDLLKSSTMLNQIPLDTSTLPDDLSEIVKAALDSRNNSSQEQLTLAPPLSLIPQLSFDPLLNAQFRLVKGASLRLIFRSHSLRHHLKLQKAFHLMGDGVFISQITAALFDSSAHGTERELGVMRSGTGMGLKLNERQSWPPASSELRLALMGILSNCYSSSSYLSPNNRIRQVESNGLPGSMSFAVRNLVESEIEQIMNPASLYALDFLRLQYTPSSPIDEVITPNTIEKYDLIFKHLLRLIRLLYSVSRLPRIHTNSLMQLFILQARHFVNSCSSYFFETIIGLNWADFEEHLNRLETSMAEEDKEQPETMRDHGGINELRQSHEACLDRILYGMFLRQRQSKVSALLDEIFTTVLKLESLSQVSSPKFADIQVLHSTFVSKIKLFGEVCRGLNGKKISGISAGADDTISRLLLSLDFNGFYNIIGPLQ